MSEHKIQSGKGSLHIEIDQVPKILKTMVDEWTREGYVVSFKLETDPELLIPKAVAALERYGHQVVIGNDLHRRKFEVVFVTRPSPNNTSAVVDPPHLGFEEHWLRINTMPSSSDAHRTKEIEEDIIAELASRHKLWIEAASPSH